jgi:hypothetical protein
MPLTVLSVFQTLGGLFLAPIRNPEMLWIIIPIYLNWVFADIYQEKRGTDLGNAVTNGAVAMWVGIDWGRNTYHLLTTNIITIDAVFAAKLVIVTFFIIYGLIIIIESIRIKKIAHFIGRIREVTYFSLMFTPIFYNIIPINLTTILAILIGFPIFYGLVELIFRIAPNPKTYDEQEMSSLGSTIPDIPSGTENLPDLSPQQPQYPRGGYYR